MHPYRLRGPLVVLVGFALLVPWHGVTAQRIPVRTLTTVIATDSGFLGPGVSVRALSNGSVFVNDLLAMRLYLLDANLKPRLVADTSGTAPNRYPAVQSTIMPYLGDTTLLTDRSAGAYIVVDPTGKFGRTMAPPIAKDFSSLGLGIASTDPRGRFVYRVTPRPSVRVAATADSPPVLINRDSSVVIRADFETRSADSVVKLGLPTQKFVAMMVGSERMNVAATNPLPAVDEWALLSDGTIAVVRVGDYHVDFIRMDGTRVSAAKMVFDWKRVTDEDKQRMLDSAKAAFEAARARSAAAAQQMASRIPPGAAGGVSMGGGVSITSSGGRGPTMLPFVGVDPSEMPDYYPPIRAGTVKADQDGNLWILPTTSALSANGLAYDVVNGKGEIVERVLLPSNRRLLAIGKGGVVYMLNSEHGFRLERATIIR